MSATRTSIYDINDFGEGLLHEKPNISGVMTDDYNDVVKALYIVFIILILLANDWLIYKNVRTPGFLYEPRNMTILSLAVSDIILAVNPMILQAKTIFLLDCKREQDCGLYLQSSIYMPFFNTFIYGIGLMVLGLEIVCKSRTTPATSKKSRLARSLTAAFFPWILGHILVVPLAMFNFNYDYCRKFQIKDSDRALIIVSHVLPALGAIFTCGIVKWYLNGKTQELTNATGKTTTLYRSPNQPRPTSQMVYPIQNQHLNNPSRQNPPNVPMGPHVLAAPGPPPEYSQQTQQINNNQSIVDVTQGQFSNTPQQSTQEQAAGNPQQSTEGQFQAYPQQTTERQFANYPSQAMQGQFPNNPYPQQFIQGQFPQYSYPQQFTQGQFPNYQYPQQSTLGHFPHYSYPQQSTEWQYPTYPYPQQSTLGQIPIYPQQATQGQYPNFQLQGQHYQNPTAPQPYALPTHPLFEHEVDPIVPRCAAPVPVEAVHSPGNASYHPPPKVNRLLIISIVYAILVIPFAIFHLDMLLPHDLLTRKGIVDILLGDLVFWLNILRSVITPLIMYGYSDL